jgi:antitoxin HigA-1
MTTLYTQDLDHTDFTDVSTGIVLNPIHPGAILREEYLNPLGMSANALAIAFKVPAPRINDIVREKRGITPDTALRLARYFGSSPEFWLNLQTAYDLRVTKQKAITDIEKEVLPRGLA